MNLCRNTLGIVRMISTHTARRASLGTASMMSLIILLTGCAGTTHVATTDHQGQASSTSNFLYQQWNHKHQGNFVIYSVGKENPRTMGQGRYAIDGALFKSAFSTQDAAIADSPGFVKLDDGSYVLVEKARLGIDPKTGQTPVYEFGTMRLKATLVHSTEEGVTNSVLLLQDEREITDGDPSVQRVLSLGSKALVRRRIKEGEGVSFDLSTARFVLSQ